ADPKERVVRIDVDALGAIAEGAEGPELGRRTHAAARLVVSAGGLPVVLVAADPPPEVTDVVVLSDEEALERWLSRR
ncbi:MAG: hypothetical protein AAFU79_13645, partial [Myxococcota bacterium]